MCMWMYIAYTYLCICLCMWIYMFMGLCVCRERERVRERERERGRDWEIETLRERERERDKETGSEGMREGVVRGSFVLRSCICFCMWIYVYGVVYVLWHEGEGAGSEILLAHRTDKIKEWGEGAGIVLHSVFTSIVIPGRGFTDGSLWPCGALWIHGKGHKGRRKGVWWGGGCIN